MSPHLALAFVGQDLVFILNLEIRIRGRRPINQVRLDSLAKWPSARSEKNTCWTFFFFWKHTEPDITHVIRVDSSKGRQAGHCFCWTELEGGLGLASRKPGRGAGSARAAVRTRTSGPVRDTGGRV